MQVGCASRTGTIALSLVNQNGLNLAGDLDWNTYSQRGLVTLSSNSCSKSTSSVCIHMVPYLHVTLCSSVCFPMTLMTLPLQIAPRMSREVALQVLPTRIVLQVPERPRQCQGPSRTSRKTRNMK